MSCAMLGLIIWLLDELTGCGYVCFFENIHVYNLQYFPNTYNSIRYIFESANNSIPVYQFVLYELGLIYNIFKVLHFTCSYNHL